MSAPVPTFRRRLEKALHDGNLTVADLARWFERPHPTVSGWLRGGQVGGAQLDAAYVAAQLALLEKKIRKRDGFPVPRLSPRARIAYLAGIKSNHHR